MKNCSQSSEQNVYQHGQSVQYFLDDLIDHLEFGAPLKERWVLPEWLTQHTALLLQKLLPRETLRCYTLFHDCGKPRCRTVDENGKQHFPNHSEISAQTWLEVGGDPTEAELMRLDMCIHTMSASDIPTFAARPEAASLLLAGLAEVHSNAKMFGGIDSTSFKIKWKQIDKRGRALCKLWTSA